MSTVRGWSARRTPVSRWIVPPTSKLHGGPHLRQGRSQVHHREGPRGADGERRGGPRPPALDLPTAGDLPRRPQRDRRRHRVALPASPQIGEIPAIRRPNERPASSRRWDGDRFAGIAPERRRIFTVRGKGGLIREVCFSPETSERLEARRLPKEIHVRDRTIDSRSAYRICGGQALSQVWSTASKRAVGFSNGFHSLRHSFASGGFVS